MASSRGKDSLHGLIKRSATEAPTSKKVTSTDSTKIATETLAQIAADPVKVNELNQEPWWQSGVGFFGTQGLLWSLGTIITQVGTHGLDFHSYEYGIMVTAIGSLLSFIAVLYRRFMPGLKPMFSGWFSPIKGD